MMQIVMARSHMKYTKFICLQSARGTRSYSSPFHSTNLEILGDSPVMKTFLRTLDQIAMTHTIDTVIDREI